MKNLSIQLVPEILREVEDLYQDVVDEGTITGRDATSKAGTGGRSFMARPGPTMKGSYAEMVCLRPVVVR